MHGSIRERYPCIQKILRGSIRPYAVSGLRHQHCFQRGLSLQQEFDWLVNLPKDRILHKPNNMELCFEEEHFDDFLQKLNAYPNIEYLGDVVEHSWGQRVVRFYDLDGHIIEVGESMKMVIRRFLDSGMTMEEVSKKMDASIEDLEKLLNG